MNQLTQYLIDSILSENTTPGKTALFGGGFKPPTRGHLEVVTQGLKDNPEVDEVYIFVGSGVRNNISQEESVKIWEMFKPFIPVKTTIIPAGSPLKDIKRFIEDMEEKPYVFIGARPDNEDDDKDVAERSKFFEKYGGIPKRVNTSDSNVSGTKARAAAKNDNKQELFSYFPEGLTDSQKEEIYDMLRSVVKETDNPDDGKAAPYGSGYGKVNENASYSKDIDIKGKIDQLTQHMISKGYNIEPLPSLEFVDGDTENARDFFGTTAYYDPTTQTVVLYTEGRHPKDIVRSYAHEMIHHIQNLEGRLGNITTTNTQEDDHLNDIEAEANLKGTMTFRNWTDSLNEGKFKMYPIKGTDFSTIYAGREVEGNLKWMITSLDSDLLNSFLEDEDQLWSSKSEAEEVVRNWVNSLNEIGDASAQKLEWNPAQIEKIAKEIERKIGNQFDDTVEYYDMLPVINVISPESRTRYRITVDASIDKPEDELAMTTLRVDFTTEEGGDNAINKGEQYKILATLTDIIIQLINRVNDIDSTTLDLVKFYAKDDTEGKYANPDSKRGKLYQAFINKNLSKLPGNWKMSTSDEVIMLSPVLNEDGQKIAKKNMDDYKKSNNPSGKVSDPFGLNAFAYEIARLDEGAYDSLTTKLTKATINKWVEDSKKKPLPKSSFVDIDIEDVDGKGREIEFNYVGMVEFDKKIDGYEVDGTSNSGEDKGKMPFVATLFRINPKVLPQAWSKISADVSDVIRHEIEHLTQAGDNVRGQQYDEKGNLVDKGKYMDDDIMIRDMINKAKVLPQSDYYKLEKEVDAMLQGLYLKAKKTKKPFADVVDNYLNIAPGIETKEDKDLILKIWRSRRKALSLPVFETKKQVMKEGMEDLYTIYLDMDGVIVDFDKQFKDAFDMSPREFEEGFGIEMFWKKIEERGVGFWRGMEWMPGGQELYKRVAQHDHYLLSSPSRSETSKIGKHMWKKDNTPNTKLILSRSYNKKNYADRSNILIDDRESNIQQWRDAGGIGILYKSADQVNKELDKLGL
jgi:hypothetical protein